MQTPESDGYAPIYVGLQELSQIGFRCFRFVSDFPPPHSDNLMVTVCLDTISGLKSVILQVPGHESMLDLVDTLQKKLPDTVSRRSNIVIRGGVPVTTYSTVAEAAGDQGLLSLELRMDLCGGKGGFGHNLRKDAKNMKGKQTRDQSRTLTGLSVRALNQANEERQRRTEQEAERVQRLEARRKKLERVLNMKVEVSEDRVDDGMNDDLEEAIRKATMEGNKKAKGKIKSEKKPSKKKALDSFFD